MEAETDRGTPGCRWRRRRRATGRIRAGKDIFVDENDDVGKVEFTVNHGNSFKQFPALRPPLPSS